MTTMDAAVDAPAAEPRRDRHGLDRRVRARRHRRRRGARSADEGAGPRQLPLHDSVTVIPGFVDFTHVSNTGAAFGILNAADFRSRPVVIAVIADVRAGRRRAVRAPARLAPAAVARSAWR